MKIEARIQEVMRRKHYSIRTEEAYIMWYKQFVRFHGLRHPGEMGDKEVSDFLTYLAVTRGVVALAEKHGVVDRFLEGMDSGRDESPAP